VLIHGLGQDGKLWDRVAPALAARHRVVIVDLPGHGGSPPLSSPSVPAVAEALDRTLKEQNVKRALLVGHSYGGLIALEEAAAHPERALGIISIDLATYVPVDSERIANLNQIIEQRYQLFVQGVFSTMTHDSTQVDSVVAKAERVPRPVLAAYFRNVWRTDLRERIRPLKTPMLVVTTAETWPGSEPWENARTRLGFMTAGPVQGRRIMGSGHLIPIDQPDSLAKVIEEYASGLKR
jgi:pimeloyl-ACP methyl ester carboxylesterase